MVASVVITVVVLPAEVTIVVTAEIILAVVVMGVVRLAEVVVV